MKTAELALTEWTCNEIKFDYQQGNGPQSHTRKEFKRTCKMFRHGDVAASAISSGGLAVSGATISQDLIDYKAFAQIQSAINTFVTLAYQRIPKTEVPKILDQHFDPMNFMHLETLQEAVTELIRKVKL